MNKLLSVLLIMQGNNSEYFIKLVFLKEEWFFLLLLLFFIFYFFTVKYLVAKSIGVVNQILIFLVYAQFLFLKFWHFMNCICTRYSCAGTLSCCSFSSKVAERRFGWA